MSGPPDWLPDAHFGVVADDGQTAASADPLDDEDPDDEMIETPPEVQLMLGFNPAMEALDDTEKAIR